MRKAFLVVVVLLYVSLAIYAADQPFAEFKWFNAKSVYAQNPADIFSANSTLGYLLLQTGQPRIIRVTPTDGSGEYVDIPIYKEGHYTDEKAYIHLKTGVNVGFTRISLFKENFELEFGLSAAINSIFQGFGGADNLGFDGVYFLGPQLRLFNKISFKFGLQHYSGHYGDETLENSYATNGVLRNALEYTRDNNLFFGVNIDILKNLSLSVEATLPREKTWMGPAVHIPSWVLKPSNGESYYKIAANDEKVAAVEYPDFYKAWIVQGGILYDHYLTKQLALSLAGFVKLHQDGMTEHTIGAFQEDNPWEAEYTLALGVVLKDPNADFTTRVNLTYHNGRTPLLNFFYQRTSYVSLSIIMG